MKFPTIIYLVSYFCNLFNFQLCEKCLTRTARNVTFVWYLDVMRYWTDCGNGFGRNYGVIQKLWNQGKWGGSSLKYNPHLCKIEKLSLRLHPLWRLPIHLILYSFSPCAFSQPFPSARSVLKQFTLFYYQIKAEKVHKPFKQKIEDYFKCFWKKNLRDPRNAPTENKRIVQ